MPGTEDESIAPSAPTGSSDSDSAADSPATGNSHLKRPGKFKTSGPSIPLSQRRRITHDDDDEDDIRDTKPKGGPVIPPFSRSAQPPQPSRQVTARPIQPSSHAKDARHNEVKLSIPPSARPGPSGRPIPPGGLNSDLKPKDRNPSNPSVGSRVVVNPPKMAEPAVHCLTKDMKGLDVTVTVAAAPSSKAVPTKKAVAAAAKSQPQPSLAGKFPSGKSKKRPREDMEVGSSDNDEEMERKSGPSAFIGFACDECKKAMVKCKVVGNSEICERCRLEIFSCVVSAKKQRQRPTNVDYTVSTSRHFLLPI